jgi:hypothetical protein
MSMREHGCTMQAKGLFFILRNQEVWRKKKTALSEEQFEYVATMSEDEIDHNLMGTFPASDPPSWTLGVERDRMAAVDDSDRTAPKAAEPGEPDFL